MSSPEGEGETIAERGVDSYEDEQLSQWGC